MAGNSFRPLAFDVLAAASLLTRLPLAIDHARAGERGAAAVWAYPVVGAGLGSAAGAAGWALQAAGCPAGPAAVVVLVLLALATGGLHEDGLADTADAFGGGRDQEARLKIMKDSRIGAFGATALGLFLLWRWSALTELPAENWVVVCGVVGALSRAAMGLAYAWLPPASASGLAASLGSPPKSAALLGLVLAAALAFALHGPMGTWPIVAALLVPLLLWRTALQMIGGRTGDVLGAIQQTGEVASLTALAILLA